MPRENRSTRLFFGPVTLPSLPLVPFRYPLPPIAASVPRQAPAPGASAPPLLASQAVSDGGAAAPCTVMSRGTLPNPWARMEIWEGSIMMFAVAGWLANITKAAAAVAARDGDI